MTDLDRQRVAATGKPAGAGGGAASGSGVANAASGPASGGAPEATPGTTSGVAPGATSGLTFEAARAELEDVVRRLEAGGCALEESLALWERGEELAALCQHFLDGARARLTPAPAPASGSA